MERKPVDSASPNPDTTTRTPEPGTAGTLPTATTPSDTTELPGSDLTPKQRTFAERRAMGDGTGTAYAAAYPTAKPATQRREGLRLSRDPRVLRYISHLRAVGFADAELSVADIAKALKRIAFFDIRKVSTERGELLPLSEWPEEAGAIVQGITAKTANSDGQPKIPDRIAALRTLAEMRGALGQGAGKGQDQPKATFVFNFGGKAAKPARPKVVLGERLADQNDVANVLPVSPRMIDADRDTSEVET